MVNALKNNKYLRMTVLSLMLVVVIALCVQSDSYAIVFDRIKMIFTPKKTVADRVEEFEGKVVPKLRSLLSAAGVNYPPNQVSLVFFKNDQKLRVYAGEKNLVFIKEYPVLAASGHPGPKLLEGDNQVPEGIYKIEALNPNSTFHLSLRVNYPNDFDKKMGDIDGRIKLGSDIMIHGRNVSIGCIAIGNEAIEELFILAAQSNWQKWELLLAPHDLRKQPRMAQANLPTWVEQLDKMLLAKLNSLPN
jgi:murein L,D-transpeptidase YafK